MIAIEFKFTANRYHATQWGRHVNEGVLEWPPSPWRILRCLVSTWRRTLPDMPVDDVLPILQKLASELPMFALPDATAAHTRHYMPLFDDNFQGKTSKSLVLDSFAAIHPKGALCAVWPNVELEASERATLSAILENLWYLGRAESWCEAWLADSVPEGAINCAPLENGVLPSGDFEPVRVLVPDRSKPLKLVDLCVETGELRRGGRIDPPGAQWALYSRKSDCFSPSHRASEADNPSVRGQTPTVVRYALYGKVQLLITDTLRVGELVRRSAMAQYGRLNGGAASETLSGKDTKGEHLKGHRHAFYIPTDESGDGYIDHITVWAQSGLDREEINALGSVRTLNPGGGRPELRLVFQSYGLEEDYEEAACIFGKSRGWRSVTPFILNQHIKFRGPQGAKYPVNGPEEQARKEVERREYITATLERAVREEFQGSGQRFHPLDFYRWRRGGSSKGTGAHNFRLVFDEPVRGPIALGFGCHFGLGLFAPDDTA